VRQKTSRNNPHSTAVTTPLGTFNSFKAAGRAHGEDPSCIIHRCLRGKLQRETGEGLKTKAGNDYADYRGYFGVCSTVCLTPGRKIRTPLGVFSSLTEAAKAEGITLSGVYQKIGRKKGGYEYLEAE
jgi:hypothetical protein